MDVDECTDNELFEDDAEAIDEYKRGPSRKGPHVAPEMSRVK